MRAGAVSAKSLAFDQPLLWTLMAGEHPRVKIRRTPRGAVGDVGWLRRSRLPGAVFCRAILENT